MTAMDRDATTTASALARDAALVAGRYKVEAPIGTGAMATVFRAHDERHDRKVALKVLRPRVAKTIAADRFLREIRVSARLAHPHIVGLIDSGDHQGMLWYTMPFVEGETLRARLDREGALPLSDVLRFGREMADALAAAHELGIVHRDVKPANVMLTGRHAQVMDFGVARAVRDAAGGEVLTREGTAVGTPEYMAPEQAAADPEVTPSADLFSLGLVLFEMTTGRAPFADLPPTRRLATLVRQPAPRVTAERPDVPPGLADLIAHCLTIAPEDRPASAAEIADALEALAADPAAGGASGAVTPAGGTTPAAGRSPVQPPAQGAAAAAPSAGVPRWILWAVLVVAAALVLWGALSG